MASYSNSTSNCAKTVAGQNSRVTSASKHVESGCPFSKPEENNAQAVGTFDDGFGLYRAQDGTLDINDQQDPVKMVLGLKAVRKSAHNWKVFQSGAKPGRIVVPSEVAIRSIRQIPFELDPPSHTQFRALIEPWFKRPLEAQYQVALQSMIDDTLSTLLSGKEVDGVRDVSLVLQSNALTQLLNVPLVEAKTWIGWGTHVFRSDDNPLDGSKANVLYEYLDREICRAKLAKPTPENTDLYRHLLDAKVDGRSLTDEEIKGIMILTFAGGRDTVINALTNTLAFFADNAAQLHFLHDHPEYINTAVEELIRYFSPLTHMGRVATSSTQICPHAESKDKVESNQYVEQDSRISLCWASANRDESVFENPNEVVLTRKANPHVGFGFGIHNCLGATHARALLRLWVKTLAQRVSHIEVTGHEQNIEQWGAASRKVGFHQLLMKFHAK